MTTQARILHAAARGARIQVNNYLGTWVTVEVIVFCTDDMPYRIHPKDEHLAYGPISTALRERVFHGPWRPGYSEALRYSTAYFNDNGVYEDDAHFYTDLLLQAEFWADEGM